MRYRIILTLVLTIGLPAAAALGALAPAPAPAPVAPVTPAPVSPAAPDARGIEYFEKKVRPLLAQHCFACHSEKNPQGGLNLRSRAAILKGGALGPALVPGDPDKSLLVQVVRYDGHLKMPPKGKLPAAELEAFTTWVRMGAPWPEAAAVPAGGRGSGAGGRGKTASPQKHHWAFRPPARVVPPVVKRGGGWVRNPIDAFVLAKLETKGLKPAPQADRRTLIRRATFDLTGLPPTPEEIEAFVNDRSTDAWEKVIDRLLASPQYGERWARHWLDVARYADTNGQDENLIYGNAWRYRDYVVRSFNADKPYDRFIQEQIAGDLLDTPAEAVADPAARKAAQEDALIATGFLMLGPKVLAEPDKPKLLMDVIDEQIDTTGRAFMGLTLGCARCHDHKFDPIPTKDYYALAGIFKSTTTIHTDGGIVSRWNERSLADADQAAARKAHDESVRAKEAAIRAAAEPAEKKRLREELKQLQAKAPQLPMAMAVQEGTVGTVRVHIRGSHLTLGDEVPRGFLTVAATGAKPSLPAKSSGRLELARWIADPKHPLTARVMVNRVWQHHFGRGIVATPDNFGILGEKPSHPELLDWLSGYFVAGAGGPGPGAGGEGPRGGNGDHPVAGGAWSIKKLHRLIMTSATYQQSSEPAAHRPSTRPIPGPRPLSPGPQLDPDNRLLWRMNRRRLEAEAIRDAILAVSGRLDRTMGRMGMDGRSGYATNDQSGNVGQYDTSRRSLYLPVVRNAVYDLFQVFDFPDPSMVTGRRDATTVAPQALFMMNSPFAITEARRFASLLLEGSEPVDSRRIDTAYRRALGRLAASAEIARVERHLAAFERELEGTEKDPQKRRHAAWSSFTQTLFASSEFVYLD